MATKLPLQTKTKTASDATFVYFDLLERWITATRMPPTVAELAAAADRSPSTTDLAINRLRDLGYITRQHLAHRAIRITAQGQQALNMWRASRDAKHRMRASHASEKQGRK